VNSKKVTLLLALAFVMGILPANAVKIPLAGHWENGTPKYTLPNFQIQALVGEDQTISYWGQVDGFDLSPLPIGLRYDGKGIGSVVPPMPSFLAPQDEPTELYFGLPLVSNVGFGFHRVGMSSPFGSSGNRYLFLADTAVPILTWDTACLASDGKVAVSYLLYGYASEAPEPQQSYQLVSNRTTLTASATWDPLPSVVHLIGKVDPDVYLRDFVGQQPAAVLVDAIKGLSTTVTFFPIKPDDCPAVINP